MKTFEVTARTVTYAVHTVQAVDEDEAYDTVWDMVTEVIDSADTYIEDVDIEFVERIA